MGLNLVYGRKSRPVTKPYTSPSPHPAGAWRRLRPHFICLQPLAGRVKPNLNRSSPQLLRSVASRLKSKSLEAQKGRLAITLASYVAYILAFNFLDSILGTITGMIITLPVLTTAWMFGLRGGLIAGITSLPLNVSMVEAFTSQSATDWMFSGGIPGSVSELLVGTLVGRLRDVDRHLSEEVAKQREAEEMIAVTDEVSRIVTSTLDFDEVYDRFAGELKRLVDWDLMNVSILDDEKDTVTIQYFSGDETRHLREGFTTPIVGSRSQQIRDFGKTVILDESEFTKGMSWELDLLNAGFRSAILVPMFSGGKVFGNISLRSRRPEAFHDREKLILEWLAGQISPAIENARLHQETLNESRLATSSLAQLKAVLEWVDAGIILICPDRKILWLNRRMKELTGIESPAGYAYAAEHDDYSGYNVMDWVNRGLSDPEEFLERRYRIYADQSFSGNTVEVEFLKPFPRLLREFTSPVFGDEGYIGRLWVYHDITDRKRAEDEIRELAKFPAQNPHPVLHVSSDAVILYGNAPSIPLLTIHGTQIGSQAPESWSKMIRESLDNDITKEFEISHGERTCSFVVAPVTDAGYANLYGLEITERKQIERMKDEFVSIASHQLLTPVTSIKGFLELLLTDKPLDLDEEQQRFLDAVSRNTDRLEKLINDLLDISVQESGMVVIEPLVFDFKEAIARLVDGMHSELEDRELKINIPEFQSTVAVEADKDRILQVMTNLIGNALKYSPNGSSIGVSIEGQRDSFLKISVEDQGPGISEPDMQNLFQKFFRVDNSTTRSATGTGLGLAISKALVELHGGDIWVESEPGCGSTFSFTLPKERALSLEPV